jgi:lysozyme family protein
MPHGVDLMLFDAAVQHGPRRAIRMLQRSVDVEADGEVGPITRSAVGKRNAARVVRAMGTSRRSFYKSLKHYRQFGRGWMRRLDVTIERGLAAVGSSPIDQTQFEQRSTEKETSPMKTEQKWWVESLTIWGTLITAISTVLPFIGPFVGLDISSAMIEQFGEAVAQLIQALGGVTGTFMAVYGRMRASSVLSQRQVSLSI